MRTRKLKQPLLDANGNPNEEISFSEENEEHKENNENCIAADIFDDSDCDELIVNPILNACENVFDSCINFSFFSTKKHGRSSQQKELDELKNHAPQVNQMQ